MTSMEAFGPVSADYYTGRRVLEVRDGAEGEGNPVWVIVFEGDAVIHNYDPTIPKPTAIVGAGLTMQVLGGHNADHQPVTELRFGLESVMLNPTEWAMSDPTYTKGQLVYAQRSEYNMPRLDTPDHPENRTAEGPEIDEQEA